MKRIFKISFSLFLSLVLVFCSIPFASVAQDNAGFSESGGITMEANNSIGKVLLQGNGGLNKTGFNISSLEMVENKPHVTFHTTGSCTLVVSVYLESGQLYSSAVERVEEAFSGTLALTLSEPVLPDYYIVQAFLLDDNNAPLCPKFTDITHTKNFENFQKKTIYDFPNQIILNFDEQVDDNFAVLPVGAVSVVSDSKNILIESDFDAGKYVFSNIDSSISSLKPGDILSYNIESDTPILIKIKSINIKGSVATIYEDNTAKISDLFDYLKLNLGANEDNRDDQIIDMSKSSPDVTFEGYAEPEPSVKTQADIVDEESPVESIQGEIPVFKIGNDIIEATINLGVIFEIAAYFDVEWKWRADFWNSLDVYYYFQTKFTVQATGEVTINLLEKDKDFFIASIDYITPAGITVGVEVSIVFGASASITFKIVSLSTVLCARFEDGVGWQDLSEPLKFKWDPSVEVELEGKVALRVSPNVTFLKIIGIKINFDFGVKVVITLFETDFKFNKFHLCVTPCLDGEASLYLESNLVGFIASEDFELAEFGELKGHLFYFNLKKVAGIWIYTEDYLCDNYVRKVYFKVVDSNDKGLSGAKITFNTNDTAVVLFNKEKFAVTDSDGNASYFLKSTDRVLSPYVVESTTTLDNYKTENKTIRVAYPQWLDELRVNEKENSASKPLKIELKSKHKAKFFVDGQLYKELYFYEGDLMFGSKIQAPSKEGYEFDGWDPSIPFMMPKKDMTFNAKFKKYETPSEITYTFDQNSATLYIKGSGSMPSYYDVPAPWSGLKLQVKHIIIEPGITSIGEEAFIGFENVETVSIPDTVTLIDEAAFYECDSLQSIDLPDSVDTVAPYAFYGCSSLTTVSLGSVESIGEYAFCLCNSIGKVTVPGSCITIDNNAFDLCYNLSRIDFMNKDCKIYDSDSTIYYTAKIYGEFNSTAHMYAKKYDRSFLALSNLSAQSAPTFDNIILDNYSVTYSSCVAGSDYILLNVTGYGAGFELTTSNLEYIDQLTADARGKVSCNFIPRNFVSGSTTLLIGDFGNGTEAKIVTPKLVSTSVEIVNNPGVLTIKYMEGIRLNAEVISPVDGCEIQWYVNGTAYTTGDTLEIEHLKSQTDITIKLVDANGNPVLKDGEEITAEETIKVNAGFFQKIIAFFKFTLFGQVVLRTN